MTRKFESGGIRDTSNGKISYLARNPLVEESFASYMTEHSFMPDGSRRSMQNWFKGFSLAEDMESLVRHVADLEALHAGYFVYKNRSKLAHETTHILDKRLKVLPDGWKEVLVEDTLNAIRFNCGVYMVDYLKLTKTE